MSFDSDNESVYSNESYIPPTSKPRIIPPYEAIVPADIRDKIFNQLELVHRFKLIHSDLDTARIFNPINDKIISKSDKAMDLVLLAYICEMRDTRASRLLLTELYYDIQGYADPDRLNPDNFLYQDDTDLLTLEHISAVLTRILDEYLLQNTHIVNIQVLTMFMREVSRRLSKMPRDLFRDHVVVYDRIYSISITLIAIHFSDPLPICASLVDMLNTYFDKATVRLFSGCMYDIVDDAFSSEIIPYYGMDEDDQDDLCVELILDVINPLLSNKYEDL